MHNGPRNVLFPVSVWAMGKQLQGRQEPVQLWAGDEANCLWPAGKMMGVPRLMEPPLCFLVMLPEQVLLQPPAPRSTLLIMARDLRTVAARPSAFFLQQVSL